VFGIEWWQVYWTQMTPEKREEFALSNRLARHDFLIGHSF